LRLDNPRIHQTAYLAESAVILGRVRIAARVVIMFGAVIRAELDAIEIGRETNIQDNAVVHADEGLPCLIGRRVTVGHSAIVHGAVVGDHCLIGIGAMALNGSVLGEGAWLAAGSVLPEGREIAPWTLAMGTPAQPIRGLTEEEVKRQDDGVDTYQRFARMYRRELG